MATTTRVSRGEPSRLGPLSIAVWSGARTARPRRWLGSRALSTIIGTRRPDRTRARDRRRAPPRLPKGGRAPSRDLSRRWSAWAPAFRLARRVNALTATAARRAPEANHWIAKLFPTGLPTVRTSPWRQPLGLEAAAMRPDRGNLGKF